MAGRTPSFCEWALGITIEEYAEKKDQRRRRRHAKNQQRFTVEVSTDNESEEDSLKITYPRSKKSSPKSTKGSPKKVRFERDQLKSALKSRDRDSSHSGSETKSSSASNSRSSSRNSSGTSTSSSSTSSHSSSSSRRRNKKKLRHRDIYLSDTTESSGDSSSAISDCRCRECRRERRELRKRAGHGKKHKHGSEFAEAGVSDDSGSSSSDDEQRSRSKKSKSKKASQSSEENTPNEQPKKKKKNRVVIAEDEETGDETSEEEARPSPKQDKRKDKGSPPTNAGSGKKADKVKGQGKGKKLKKQEDEPLPDPELIKDNNVVPTEKDQPSANEISPKNEQAGSGKKKKKKKQKAQNQGNMRPEADVPAHLRRPNLIMPVSAQVLQVEHAIEGIEDPRPNAFHDGEHGVVRVYHGPTYGNPYGILYPPRSGSRPAHIPLAAGTPHPALNPYINGFANTAKPDDVQNQEQSPWNSVSITSMPDGPPMMATAGNPVMSGGLGADNTFGKPRARDNPWTNNTATSQGYPINVNMYSYAGRDRWSDNGRKMYSSPQKYSSPDKRRVAFDPMNADANNDAPKMYGAGGSHNGSNTSSSRRKATHPDVTWSPRPDEPKPATGDWVNKTSSNNDPWGASGAGDNVGGGMNNDTNGNTGWGTSNDNNANNSNDTWGASNNNRDTNGGTWDQVIPSGNSNSSKGSKKSNRGDNGWWGGDNAPPLDSGGSNHSGGSKSQGNGAVDSNVVPGDPWDTPATTTGDILSNDDPSKNMPGSWDTPKNGNGDPGWQGDDGGGLNAVFNQTTPGDNGGYPWGDTSAAQNGTGNTNDNVAW